MLTTEQAYNILTKLQTFWPIEWSPRMDRRHETSATQEIQEALREFDAQTALEALRTLYTTTDRPPSMRQIIDACHKANGTDPEASFVWDQYIARWIEYEADGTIYEAVDAFPIKIYTDGRVVAPNGRKTDPAVISRLLSGRRRAKMAAITNENLEVVQDNIYKHFTRINGI